MAEKQQIRLENDRLDEHHTGCDFFVKSDVSYTRFFDEEDEENEFSSPAKSPTIPPRPTAEKMRKLRIPNTVNILKQRRQSQT